MHSSIRVTSFATLLLTVGCSVGPHYRSPRQQISQFHEAPPELTTSGSVDPRWWQQLDDPILDSVIQASLKSNNDIAMSLAHLQEVRSIFDERKLDRYPVAPVDASYSYAREQVPGFFNKPATINTFRTGFDAVWETDIFGGVKHGVAAAQHATEAAAADVQALKVSIAAEVAMNYFVIRSAQWRLEVAQHTVSNQKDTLRVTQNRRDAGLGETQDVASAAARVAAVEATIPPLEFEIKRAQYRISVLSNVKPGELAVDLSPHAYQPISKMLAIGKPDELLQRRPDVLAAERRLAQASETVGVARAQEFPQVSVSAFIGFLAGRGSTFFTPDSLGASVGPSISWSAFDLGRNRARLRGAKANLDESTAAYQDIVLRALEETEDSFAEYRSQHKRLVKLMMQANESKRAADIARLRYREGVIDFLTLLDTERTELEAENGVATTEGEEYISIVRIYKALGGIPR
ncbi:efflux transporter outer membrane subunit [Terriglobus saanensis]|uniref:RND efflux system, outer membrane lipoprotein, NodT family n=1 Tax=Terriglobus saanensis (strain ATCC BAA-1853 / DSM 23119 / SP1PR4) TaxID=401053 RepID=E8UYE5_TERSS|nr:TolC family protein [Terriglobus saanensis]ADV82033.1 RND efflux system, outer membrane lipoprotein, NodT family [Terriglobus saanensis SP1PR4]